MWSHLSMRHNRSMKTLSMVLPAPSIEIAAPASALACLPFKASKATLALKSGINLFLLACTCTSRMRQCPPLKESSNIRGPLQAEAALLTVT
jgi:hypothetical protein